MRKTPQKFRAAIWLLSGFLVISTTANAQYYDLTVGTERHFSICGFWFPVPCIPEEYNNATEKVIDEIELDGKTYAVVVWHHQTGKTSDFIGIDLLEEAFDTTYYRMEGSVLFEYANGTEQAIFDYGFSKGDSILTIVSPYLIEDPSTVLSQYRAEFGVASMILIDTLIQFNDGLYRHVLWGDDTLTFDDKIYAPPNELDFVAEYDLPVPAYAATSPFYYIKGMGVVLTPFNHRHLRMCGYKTPEGDHFGCEISVLTHIEDNMKDSFPRSFEVMSNYPNPFNPSTTINYQLHKSRLLKVSLYTSAGMLAGILRNDFTPAGHYSLVVDMSDYASGVYLVVFEFDREIQTQPITFMK